MPDSLSTPADRIRSVRYQKNWTIAQLAEMTGISPEEICYIENGVHVPRVPTLQLLANALESTVWYLGSYETLPEDTMGQKIKKARLFQGLTRAEFAQMLEVNESTVVKWENGKWNPEEKYLKILIEYITVMANQK
jgi:transcriptional regulator with XRE-family HTH domain